MIKKLRKDGKKHSSRATDHKSLLFDQSFFQMSCASKKKYDTEWQAKFAADEQMQRCNVLLNWYKCDFCGYWHLTSNT